MSWTRSLFFFLAVLLVSSEAGPRRKRAPTILPSAGSAPDIGPFRLNCGATDNAIADGEIWVPDSEFVRGGEATVNNAAVANADGLETLFQTARVDSVTSRRGGDPRGFEYTISFGSSNRRDDNDDELAVHMFYRLRLYFSEPEYTAVNSREFDVFVNGNLILPSYDILEETDGALNTATSVRYDGIRPVENNNEIVVKFQSTRNEAWVNALRVDIMSIYVILVDCGLVDEVALSDKYFYGGEAVDGLPGVPDTRLPNYEGYFLTERRSVQRFNRVDEIYYALPAPINDNNYSILFGFAESVHNSPGQRVFSVLINGVALPELTNLDIWDRVGQNIALEIYVDEISSVNGLITIEFVSTVGVASVRYFQYSTL